MRITVEQLNGDTSELEVTSDTTMSEVEQMIKETQTWEDEVSRDTTIVEVIVGDKKVKSDETVAELGMSEGSKVSAVFRKNLAVCSNKRGLGADLDPEAMVVVEIPDSETEIGSWAFQGCERIAKVIIPNSVTQIAGLAFNGCSSLIDVMIPDSVTSIGKFAFANCSSLAAVNIPHSVIHIGHRAFYECESLVTVNIPDSVMQIEDGAFDFCSELTLTAPARLLRPEVGMGIKMVAKECGCGDCMWSWLKDGGTCPVYDEGRGEPALKRKRSPSPTGPYSRT